MAPCLWGQHRLSGGPRLYVMTEGGALCDAGCDHVSAWPSSPATKARRRTSERLRALSLLVRLARWTSTVRVEIPSLYAVILLGCPLTKPSRTSRSRGVSTANCWIA